MKNKDCNAEYLIKLSHYGKNFASLSHVINKGSCVMDLKGNDVQHLVFSVFVRPRLKGSLMV